MLSRCVIKTAKYYPADLLIEDIYIYINMKMDPKV
jgi:hypothetical protein